ncbi:MAG: hypothetical protein WAO00_03250 [Chthoniobacterales bacterium]
MTHSRNKILVTTALALTWVAALGYGMQVLWKYETTPGPSASVASDWPSGSIVPRQPDKPTLLMVAHPHCPCTRASIAELAQIMAHAPDGTTASVLFVKPSGAGSDWDDTDLRRSAAAIPGVSVTTDENGVEAARFGAETSGHTLVFDRSGTLLFSGGITGTRGHAGANAGESAVLAALRQQTPGRGRTSVFGCLLAQRTPCREGESCSN